MSNIKLTTGIVPIGQMALDLGDKFKVHQERVERITAWKKKSWLDFCKMVMDTDKRFSLLPMTDYYTNQKEGGMLGRLSKASGVFSNFCLRREGSLQDVYIVPHEPNLGIMINAGSKYIGLTMTGYPSKSLVWPIICIADDMERQFIREVTIESNKHNSVPVSTTAKKKRHAK